MVIKKLNIFEKLMNIQCKIKAPKSLYNKFGKYNYRNCESILEAVKPFLETEKCALILNDDIVDGYVKSTVTLINTEKPEEMVVSQAFAKESVHKGMSSDQCTGTASSYARKYALNALFLLDDTKDSDTNEVAQMSTLSLKCEKCGKEITVPEGWTVTQMQEYFNQKNEGHVECSNCRKAK